jgi:hypothetical protein
VRHGINAFRLGAVIREKEVGMSIKKVMLSVGAMLPLAIGTALSGAHPASAATPACGSNCLSIFNRELGTYAQPSFVEDILGGQATAGQPVGLAQATGSDPSEDIIPRGTTVSDFYAAGMVSADVNQNYGPLQAVQQEYAPSGVPSGLCVGLATVAYEHEGLTLEPCSVPGTTVWIVDRELSPAAGYFAIINGSTTDFSRPFAMDLPREGLVSAHQTLQMQVRRLQFLGNDKTLPDRQLWGAHKGPFA